MIRDQLACSRPQRSYSASTKASASKSCRSSIFSPTPTSLTGHREFARQAKDHAAASRAVELGQHQTGQADRLVKQPQLGEGVLAGRRVEDQERLVGGSRDELEPPTAGSSSSLHQVDLVASARRVRDDGVVARATAALTVS